MDECELTREQIQKLMDGEKVSISFIVPGEFGSVTTCRVKLVPIKIYCKRCSQSIVDINECGFCSLCSKTDYGPYIDEAHGR